MSSSITATQYEWNRTYSAETQLYYIIMFLNPNGKNRLYRTGSGVSPTPDTVKCDMDRTSYPWKQYQTTLFLSIHMEQLSSHQKNSHEILYVSIFQTSAKKVQVSLKSYKNNRYFTSYYHNCILVCANIQL